VRWLAFGTYDVQAHPRVAVLLEGLTDHGELVEEVVEPLGLSTAARVELLRRPWRLPWAAGRVLARWSRLTARTWPRLVRRHDPAYDAVLVGYLGHFDVLLARALILTGRVGHPRRPGPTLVLDHLVSAAGTAHDRGLAGPAGLKTRLLSALDAAALRAAHVVVVDTSERLPELTPRARSRAVVVPVGATREWFAAGSRWHGRAEPGGPLRVVFVGLFTPLQGVETIARALAGVAPLMADGTLEVTLVGTGQDHARAQEIIGRSPGVTWLDWVPAPELPELVASHHVGLGIFGTTAKARAVVPTKVFQAAAAGCAVVTSDTAPQRDSLGDSAVFVPPGDPTTLAETLHGLAANRPEVDRLRVAAFRRAQAAYSAYAVVTPLLAHLSALSRDLPRKAAS
jgi:glycosyltransferase involved in cell wall biosynthesis